MYRQTYIDGAGHTRKALGYYTLSKPNKSKVENPVFVKARDKASAANKLNRKYKMSISPSQLREISYEKGFQLEFGETYPEFSHYSRSVWASL